MVQIFKQIYNDDDRKNLFTIGVEVFRLIAKYKSRKGILYYSKYLMYKRDSGNIQDYVSGPKLRKFKKEYLWNVDYDLIDKIYASQFFNRNNIPTPKMIGKLENNRIYFCNQDISVEINSPQEFLNLLDKYAFKKYSSCFVKKTDSAGGKDVFKISKNGVNNCLDIDFHSTYIIEETLRQHEKLNRINPYCINTLRVVSYREGNEIYFLTCLLRMGVGQSPMDGSTGGGIFIKYDYEANKLDEKAYSFFKHGGKTYHEHPDSKIKFKDFSLPYPQKVKDLVKKASLLINKQILGWDVAYTPEGPVIIEVNQSPNHTHVQIMNKGLLSNIHYKKMFKYNMNVDKD